MSRQDSKQIENVKVMLLKGEKGSNIESIEKTGTSGVTDTYTVTLTDGTKITFTVTNGNNIESIEKTGTQGLVDTYTVTLTDGTTTTFTVTNGNGIENIQKTGTQGLVDTYTITFTNGTTTTFNVTNGQDGGSASVDSAFSDSSQNALQNRIITGALKANGNIFYFDYHDGKYGFNTSPNRGADTFIPFKGATPIYLDGVEQDNVERVDITSLETNIYANVPMKTFPYNSAYCSAVMLNNEIHILGGTGGLTSHYKWNGTDWVLVSTLPYNFQHGDAVVFNGEIHIFGGGSSDSASTTKNHYKWDGSSWTSVSTLPFNFYNGSAVVWNNSIHLVGTQHLGDYKKHYRWTGTSWSAYSTLPYDFGGGSAIVFNNELHILGSGSGMSNVDKYHYKNNGTGWSSVSTLTYSVTYPKIAFVLDNELSYSAITGVNPVFIAKYNGSGWDAITTPIRANSSSISKNGDAILVSNDWVQRITNKLYDVEITQQS